FAPAENRRDRREEALTDPESIGTNGDSSLLTSAATASRSAIRFGLAAIKGIGEVAVQAILKARSESGRFESLSDMCQRVDGRSINRKVLEALIKCGACDGLGRNRATLFAQIEHTLARAASIIADRQRGQSSLFGALEERCSPAPE